MAFFDPERKELVIRIVYDGLATVGKTANLRALYSAFSSRSHGDPFTPGETNTGRTLYFDWIELRCGHLDDWPIRCQVLSVPGQLVLAERRFRLLRQTDAAVLVCESTPQGLSAARFAWTFLSTALGATGRPEIPVIIQANKQDAADALQICDIEPEVMHWKVPSSFNSAPRVLVPASAVRGEGVRETFLTALRLARENVRAALGGLPPTTLPRSDSADALFEALRAAESGPQEAELAQALDATLHVLAQSIG